VPAAFALSLVQIISNAIQKGFDVRLFLSNKSLISTMRERLAEDALACEPDYILWLDVDQTYPADIVERLAAHVDAGKLIVAGMTPDKRTGVPLIFMIFNDQFHRPDRVKTKVGCVPVDGMGFGGVMVHPSVFKEITQPYFNMRVRDDRVMQDTSTCPAIEGEDLTFYAKAKDAGIQAWVDTDIPYGHITVRLQEVVGMDDAPAV
jgi:hypothetical protein